MIAYWFGRWPRLVIRRKGGRVGVTSRVVSLVGWSHVDRVQIGEHVYLGPGARLFAMGGISIGDGTDPAKIRASLDASPVDLARLSERLDPLDWLKASAWKA